MLEQIFSLTVAVAALLAALVAGVFLTFSDFVMRSLAGTQPEAGIEAMQRINREVYRSLFMALLLGTATVSLVIAVIAVVVVGGAAALWLTAGTLTYLIGVIAVTARYNVPMNEKLGAIHHRSWAAQFYWPTYRKDWTRWNHVRSGAALAAAGCYLAGALMLGQPS